MSQLPLPNFEETTTKAYKGIYAMHKYWGKNPSELVSRYIQRYTNDGDIVLDSFCGSGVTIIESIRLNRKAIGIDINPVSILITKMGLEKVNTNQLLAEYNELEARVKQRIVKLYETTCPNCGSKSAFITHLIWVDNEPNEAWIQCNNCNSKKLVRNANTEDKRQAQNPSISSHWVPRSQLFHNGRINVAEGQTVADLFTQRALVALSIILEEIDSIKNPDIKNVFRFCFSGALPQASNLVFVIRRRGKQNGASKSGNAEVGSWVIGYWVPSEHFEINAWRCFATRFNRVIRGKKQVNLVIPDDVVESQSFTQLENNAPSYFVTNGSATNLPVPANSIDYAFIDPPHGNRLPYLELSMMWNAWLGLEETIKWEDEIVISEAKARNKDEDDYNQRLSSAISEIHRTLKDGKHMSLVFNSLDESVWISILNICISAGFEIIEITSLTYSARSVIQDTRKNALKTDFVITCRKSSDTQLVEIALNSNTDEINIAIHNYLSSNLQAATYEILNKLLVESIYSGAMFSIKSILKILENNFNYVDGYWKEYKNND